MADEKCRVLSKTTEWDFLDEIEKYSAYEALTQHLYNASSNDTVILNIDSPGGLVKVGFYVIRAIQKSNAHVIANIVWPSASMASLIACACDELIIQKHAYLMFHAYSGGTWGKADDLVQNTVETHRALNGYMQDIVCPFITRKELTAINDGKDKYIHWDDEDLSARIKRHYLNKGK